MAGAAVFKTLAEILSIPVALEVAMTLQEIQLETSADDLMQMVIQAIETNNWLNPATSEYKKVSDGAVSA